MYLIIVDGKVLDYKFKKHKAADFIYSFYIGDIFVGQLFRMRKNGWSCVPRDSYPLSPMDGFRSRFDAAECLLKMCGYRTNQGR